MGFQLVVTFLAFGGAFVLLFAMLMLRQLLRIRLIPPSVSWVHGEEVPATYWRALSPGIRELGAAGFKPLLWLRVESSMASQWRTSFTAVLRAPDGVLALVELLNPFDPQAPVRVHFASPRSDGSWFNTYNHFLHLVVASDPKTTLLDARAETLADQLTFHREQMVSAPGAGFDTGANIEVIVQAQDAAAKRGHAALIAAGDVAAVSDGHQFTLRAAMRNGWRMVRGGKAPRSAFVRDVDVPVALLVEAWRRHEELRARPNARVAWVWGLGLSMLVTLASFAGWFDLQTAVYVVVVLAIHEAGHYVAMRLCGYSDVRVFFLPFFGAATMGKARGRTLTKELFILLAGPLPGILLGVAVAFSRGPEWTEEFAIWLLVLNGLNLLPLYPFDGGRVVDVLFGDLHRAFDLAIKGLALIAFVAGGIWLGDAILFGLAAIVAFTMRNGAMHRVERACRRAGASQPAEVMAKIVEEPSLRGPKGLATMQTLMPRLESPPATGMSRLTGALVYAALLLPVVFYSAVFWVFEGGFTELAGIEETVVDCAAPTADGSWNQLTIRADFGSVLRAEEVAASLGARDDANCPLTPWTSPAVRDEQVAARRTWAAVHRHQRQEDDVNPSLSFEEAAERVRNEGPWVVPRMLEEQRPSGAWPSELQELAGYRACSSDDWNVNAQPWAGVVNVHMWSEPPAHVERVLAHLCEGSALDVRVYTDMRVGTDHP
ncbi:MAG: site-2 protease family protein [Myxococcota bacterium]